MTAKQKTLTQRSKLLLLPILAAYWLAQVVSTHLPAEQLPSIGTGDKTCHVLAFAILASLFWLVLSSQSRPLRKKLLSIFLILPTYAALDEITQPLTGRHASVYDWLADIAGIAIGITICILATAIINIIISIRRSIKKNR